VQLVAVGLAHDVVVDGQEEVHATALATPVPKKNPDATIVFNK
jgi:hypothetical protein